MKLKQRVAFLIVIVFWAAGMAEASQGVAIQRVITNTRSELGQLASSNKAKEIARLLKKFDTQYQTWNQTCGGDSFTPDETNDACKAMADQMKTTAHALYTKLSDYLPDVAARYEQGARSSKSILSASLNDASPAELYNNTMNGVEEAPAFGSLSPGEADAPFDVAIDEIPDSTDAMFEALEKLVPDFGKEIPEVVRAGNAQISMMKKARKARALAARFERAALALEAQREYGEIVFNVTKAVAAMPEVFKLQYTGTRLNSSPNQKVLDYYRSKKQRSTPAEEKKKKPVGGFPARG